MSQTKSPLEAMQDWQALQQQYWNAWSDATRNAVGGTPTPATPWHEGMEQWSRMLADSGKQSETAERLMAGAKNYVALMQSLVATASGKNAVNGPLQAWTDAMRGGFNIPGADASMFNNPMAAMLRGIGGPGANGFEKLSENLMPFIAQAKQECLSWLRVPAFGLAREHQEHTQKKLLAFAEYQDALGRYNALILKSSQRSFEIFESKLGEHSEPGRQIDSMRGLYDLWVDAAEAAYAEIALSDEFRKVYGDVVNAQTRVRAQIQHEVERIATDLGMPTRSELNSVHKRLHEMQRKFRALQEPDGESAQVERSESAEAEAAPATRNARRTASIPRPSPSRTVAQPKAVPVKSPVVSHSSKAARRHKRAAAVAAPQAVSKGEVISFRDAIKAMRRSAEGKSGGKKSKRKKSAKAVVSVSAKHASIATTKRRGDA